MGAGPEGRASCLAGPTPGVGLTTPEEGRQAGQSAGAGPGRGRWARDGDGPSPRPSRQRLELTPGSPGGLSEGHSPEWVVASPATGQLLVPEPLARRPRVSEARAAAPRTTQQR